MTHEVATLAPNAGAGLGKVLFDRLLAEKDFVDLLVEGVRAGLTATYPRRWDKETESWQTDPDGKTRCHTVLALMAQAEGEPVKRIIHQQLGPDGKIDTLGALRDSPALQAAIERALEKSKFRQAKRTNHAEAIAVLDVE